MNPPPPPPPVAWLSTACDRRGAAGRDLWWRQTEARRAHSKTNNRLRASPMKGAVVGRSALDLSANSGSGGSGSSGRLTTRTLSQEIEFQRKEKERTGKGGGEEKQQKHDTLGKLPNWLRPRSADRDGRQQGSASASLRLSSSHSPTQDSRLLGKSPSSPNSSTSPGGRLLSRDYR